MSIRIKRRWILAISCLMISGCTEKTIVTEVPATGSTEASAPETSEPDSGTPTTTGDGSNMVSGDTDISEPNPDTTGNGSNMVSGDTDTDTDTDTEVGNELDTNTEIDEDTEQLEDPLEQEQSDDNSSVTPDTPVSENGAADETSSKTMDCGQSLPCRWTSEDEQFTLTVSRADNRSTYGVMQLEYSISTVHDTQVSVSEGGLALDDSGVSFNPSAQLLGGTDSANEHELLAGSILDGSITFDSATDSSFLSEWSISMSDGGITRSPSFSNIPVDTITNSHADCELVLPCIWTTPQGDVTVTLTSAGGFASTGSLSTTFAVQSETTINVALEAGALAISTRGTQYIGRTQILGSTSGYKKLVAEAYAGYDLFGAIQYYKKTEVPTALNELSLVLYQDDPVPRWNPKFINIPIQ
ncbi:hypothetical protein [Granulosicoccus antarcticus]|uniref:Uncharacterized protein n=1 Tax=Granulosicoccus antarcticus IMCC3135 TaxID=1192854 RepID=A0A2Z2NPF4_9GAMM|nr:hypothetical protein [Granulosicoccus antarcticus]ASJ71811.1 hypothetical protein IMCC3135_08560 [Granulosicoccus antarcticus IMCC3135]